MHTSQWQYSDSDFGVDWAPWHRDAGERLGGRYLQGSLHSGLLLRGAAGLGKRAFAKQLSAFLLCDCVAGHSANSGTNATQDGLLFEEGLDTAQRTQNHACGNCASCQLLKAATHPDIHLVGLLDNKKEIGIDQVRELIDVMQKTPQVAQVKVAILDPADSMNESASSALLKMLEEPPPQSYFILVSDYFDRLLPTIRSRCFLQPFAIPDYQAASEYLTGQFSVDDQKLDSLWQKHHGFVQRVVDELAQDGEEQLQDFAPQMLAFLQQKATAKTVLDSVDKDNLVHYADACMSLFADADRLNQQLPTLSFEQVQTLYWRSQRLAKEIKINPLGKLIVSDYLSDCKRVFATAR